MAADGTARQRNPGLSSQHEATSLVLGYLSLDSLPIEKNTPLLGARGGGWAGGAVINSWGVPGDQDDLLKVTG